MKGNILSNLLCKHEYEKGGIFKKLICKKCGNEILVKE